MDLIKQTQVEGYSKSNNKSEQEDLLKEEFDSEL